MKILFSIFLGVVSSFFLCTETQNSYENIAPNQDKLAASIAAGKEIYQDFCIQCHLVNGKGSEVIPPLDNSNWLLHKRKESIHAVKFGQSGPIEVNGKKYKNNMPAMGLIDEEIADVINYIMNSWSNKQTKMVTVAEVESVKK